jgi:3-deoxy-D-manno-octulosonic-acid transferase
MYLLYSLGLSIAFLSLLPYFIYQGIRHGKYLSSLRQRVGSLPPDVAGDGRSTIWIHAVSVGEFMAARPLIKLLASDLPRSRIVVSTTTLTGQRLAVAQLGPDGHRVFYFPFDWAFSVRRALDLVNPSLVVLIESELWPNFLRECRACQVKVVVANGRISAKSFRRYKLIKRFIARVLSDLSLFLAQSEADAERCLSLGAPADRVITCGNLKYDVPGQPVARKATPSSTTIIDERSTRGPLASGITASPSSPSGEGPASGRTHPTPIAQHPSPIRLDRQFGLSNSQHLLVAGSTAPGEERILLDALAYIRARPGCEETRMVLAPRHPERFEEVARLLENSPFTHARRSSIDEGMADRNKGCEADVILLDTIGELADVYSLAEVVFVGGSLVDRGGHNILEPAVFAKPIIVGPHTGNFRQIVTEFLAAGGLLQINPAPSHEAEALAKAVVNLIEDREAAKAMGRRASSILTSNRGATRRAVDAILKIIE